MNEFTRPYARTATNGMLAPTVIPSASASDLANPDVCPRNVKRGAVLAAAFAGGLLVSPTASHQRTSLGIELSRGSPTNPADLSVATDPFRVLGGLIELPRHFDDLRIEMAAYQHLPMGWDGADSVSPSDLVIRNAISFLEMIPIDAIPPEATVSGDGKVGWFWHLDNGYIGVNFSADGTYAYYAEVPGREIARGHYKFETRVISQDLLKSISMASR